MTTHLLHVAISWALALGGFGALAVALPPAIDEMQRRGVAMDVGVDGSEVPYPHVGTHQGGEALEERLFASQPGEVCRWIAGRCHEANQTLNIRQAE